jgi:transcriptional regulator with XRE-family HTH domain
MGAIENQSRRDFAKRLREGRERSRLSQSALANLIGRDQADISRIEHGQANPSLATVLNLAAALDAELMLVPRKKVPEVERLLGRPEHNAQQVSSVFEEVFVPDPPEGEQTK